MYLVNYACDRGKTKRSKVCGILVHTTGSGLVQKAIKLKKDPNEYAVEYYKTSVAYPHYLIDWNGAVFTFCDEMKWAAHAKWTKEESKLYVGTDWLRWCELKGELKEVNPKAYQAWIDRWGGSRGLAYTSPKDILRQIGGTVPNSAYIGIEILDRKPFNELQHKALSGLTKDICERHKLVNVEYVIQGSLPQAWLCTHSDVSPIRRWAIRKNGSGFAYDCRYDQLDWNKVIEGWK